MDTLSNHKRKRAGKSLWNNKAWKSGFTWLNPWPLHLHTRNIVHLILLGLAFHWTAGEWAQCSTGSSSVSFTGGMAINQIPNRRIILPQLISVHLLTLIYYWPFYNCIGLVLIKFLLPHPPRSSAISHKSFGSGVLFLCWRVAQAVSHSVSWLVNKVTELRVRLTQ